MRNAALFCLLASSITAVSFATTQTVSHFEWDGSRTTPVHRFPMFDEFGQQIVPSYSQALPMSSRNTCGTCHTYSAIEQGWHFNSSRDIASPGRPGEPWVWVDEATGTMLPISYRRWPGTHHPTDLGMSEWRFTQLFGRHMPGGDMGEPVDDIADPESRWDLSGQVEINCLACHNGSHEQDQGEWAKQMARENFRWAATAASGYGEVVGMASRVRSHWTIFDGPNPDDTEFAVAPAVEYYTDKFDSKGRTVFNVLQQPPDRNCLQCHSVTEAHAKRMDVPGDVHSLVGLKCADCHRNDLSHRMVRGFEGEEKQEGMAHAAEFSCRGCHIGAESGTMRTMQAGRLGAPKPVHVGIPPVHFETMACTSCHSGPIPSHQPSRVRTSRINRIGIHGRAEWFTDEPVIVEPVFVRNDEGVIEPRRMMWPAYFARMEGNSVRALTPDQISTATAGILDARQQITTHLKALSADTETTGGPVLIAHGKVLSLDRGGSLMSENFEGTPTLEGNWAWRENPEIVYPLLSGLDPAEEELSFEAEQQLVMRLEMLAQDAQSSQPGMLLGGVLHRIALDGTLQKTEVPDQNTSVPQWVIVDGDGLRPLVTADAIKAAVETVGSEHWMTEEQISRVLERLALGATGQTEYAYVSNGKLFQRNADGSLTAGDHAAAAPVSWAIGHDVRPTAQSLGIRSCQECHDASAPFFHSMVEAAGPLKTALAAVTPMHLFQSRDANYERLFGYSFQWREWFKTFLFASAAFLALVLAAYTLVGMRRAARYVGNQRPPDE